MKDFWQQSATTLAVVVVSMVGFWLIEAKDYAKESTVKTMINEYSPYLHDKQAIETRLSNLEENNNRFLGALERNTEAMHQLKEELASLKAILSYLEREISNNKKDGV